MPMFRVFYDEPSYTDIEASDEDAARELFLEGEWWDETHMDPDGQVGEPKSILKMN